MFNLDGLTPRGSPGQQQGEVYRPVNLFRRLYLYRHRFPQHDGLLEAPRR